MQTSTGSDGGFATVGSQAGAQSAAAKNFLAIDGVISTDVTTKKL